MKDLVIELILIAMIANATKNTIHANATLGPNMRTGRAMATTTTASTTTAATIAIVKRCDVDTGALSSSCSRPPSTGARRTTTHMTR